MRSIATTQTALVLAAALITGSALAAPLSGCSFFKKTFTRCGREQLVAPIRSTGATADIYLNSCLDHEWELYDQMQRYIKDAEETWTAARRLGLEGHIDQIDRLLVDFAKSELDEAGRREAVDALTGQVLELLAARRMAKRLGD